MLRHLPNVITCSRIALVPAIASTILAGKYSQTIPLFGYCATTDFIDGWLARRYQWKSKLGSILDPLADKLLIGTVAGCLWKLGHLGTFTTEIVLTRDVLLVGFGLAFGLKTANPKKSIEVKPLLSSKINTFLQMLLLLIAFAEGIQEEHEKSLEANDMEQIIKLRKIMEKIVCFSTIWSGCSYGLNYRKSIIFK